MTYRERCDAKLERTQQRLDAGLVSKRFPEVESIVVDMKHRRQGITAILLLRTLTFSAGSPAHFHVECLNTDCTDCTQGFDLDQVVSGMVRSHASSRTGDLDCQGNGLTSGHVNIAYTVTIRYHER